jgi:hypothetical protein
VGAFVLLLATVGALCCVAIIVAIWWFHQAAYERVEKVAARLDGGLARASGANQKVQDALEQARRSVEEVREESAAPAGGGVKGRLSTSAARKLVRKKVGPNINDLSARLATLSDAATAISSLLQSFQESQPFQTGRIRPDNLEGWTDQAEQLSGTLRRLEAAVGEGDKDGSAREVAGASRAVHLALQRCQLKLDDWQSQLEAARDEVRDARAQVLGWLTAASLAASFLVGWVALGQISLFLHALRW